MDTITRMSRTLPLYLALATVVWAQQPDPLHMGQKVPPGCVAVLDGTTVSEDRVIEEVIRAMGRPGGEADAARQSLIEETIVTKALRERGLKVTSKELDQRVAQLKKQIKQGTLASILVKQGITRAAFDRKLRSALALEKLARMDMKLPPQRKVDNQLMNIWLMDHRDKAVLVTDRKKLDSKVAFSVDGIPVLKRRLVQDILPTVKGAVVRKKVIDPLLQQILAERILKKNGLTLTEADVMREWLDRKQAFEDNPTNKTLKFETVVHQQTGEDVEAFRQTAGFRVRAAINLMGRKLITRSTLEEGYRSHGDLYGPRLSVRHLILRASDNPKVAGHLPTYSEVERNIQRIHREIVSGMRFEDAVRMYSEDLGTKYKGGRLPVFTPGNNRLDPAFVKVALGLEIDTISKPFKTTFGWHIMRLDQKQPVPPLPEVEGDLRRRLGLDLFRAAWARAKIGVDLRL